MPDVQNKETSDDTGAPLSLLKYGPVEFQSPGAHSHAMQSFRENGLHTNDIVWLTLLDK